MNEFVGLHLGHYRLLRRLGGGGMGEVYLAEDQRLTRQVAVKTLTAQSLAATDVQKWLRQFRREARAIAALDHPHILQLIEYDVEAVRGQTIVYIVMPFYPEGSLDTWLARLSMLAPQEKVRLLRQAADALQHAHDQQIVHRDVKPANFLVRSRGQDMPTDLLLADFGVAAFMNGTTSTGVSTPGTPFYMAPEQWRGQTDYKSDQYSLAVTAYELLTGQTPFQGDSLQLMYQHLSVEPRPPSTINPRLPRLLDAPILKALAKDPRQRFATIRDFALALEQATSPGRFRRVSLKGVHHFSGALRSPSSSQALAPVREAAAAPSRGRFSATPSRFWQIFAPLLQVGGAGLLLMLSLIPAILIPHPHSLLLLSLVIFVAIVYSALVLSTGMLLRKGWSVLAVFAAFLFIIGFAQLVGVQSGDNDLLRHFLFLQASLFGAGVTAWLNQRTLTRGRSTSMLKMLPGALVLSLIALTHDPQTQWQPVAALPIVFLWGSGCLFLAKGILWLLEHRLQRNSIQW